MSASRLPILAIAGPTASGKTAAALALAQAAPVPVEIISVDSALVYRGMDIGTAKPTADERAVCPHHLIDIRDPLQPYSAAEFVRDAVRLVAEIRARGALPLLVGGTMLYLKALVDGMDDMPAANPGVRAALDAEAAQVGWPAMHAQLAQVDPVTAARLAPGDSQRIQRALEVWRVTGKPLSSLHGRRAPASGLAEPTDASAAGSPATGLPAASPSASNVPAADAATAKPLGDEPVHLISLEPAERSWLHARIAQRFDAMLAAGFLDEVQALRARGDLDPDLPSMRAVGYRQAWEALDSRFPLAELRERGVAATRQLAKRQITWLRAMPQRHVVAADAPDALARTLAAAHTLLNRAGA
ncbi:tRNA (adenosine(37)-N6)-dimethylallyltransferase MiaA [Comamonas serinivorans]|uniref:tRNA dimethylallyltransferase n=1 Tax=Comamonas serinivorans TaxID=1082851 RepID=A0A1Y0ENL5_9BURK|nr:tRNA (adenosine(37)-N6)-dimethylallyltransferase MiaA [Comamonas serinivorans]ARU05217.1 tRNA (adenosine(37)-N6)-dimethylallyltransferase MiaA [Comamonas serinivorans]